MVHVAPARGGGPVCTGAGNEVKLLRTAALILARAGVTHRHKPSPGGLARPASPRRPRIPLVQPLFRQVLRFFAATATALTGLGAVCTAAGFLAERTRWSLLGFGAQPADLNEYLFTGARFLGFLPGIVLSSVLTAAVASLTSLLLAVVALFAFLAARRLRRSRRGEAVTVESTAGRWGPRLRTWGLAALVVVQLAGSLVLFQAGRLRNILFTDRGPLAGVGCERGGLGLEAQVLLGCEEELTEHLGRVFLIVFASGAALWLLLPPAARGTEREGEDGAAGDGAAVVGGESAARPPPGPGALAWVNLGLLAIQVILLPINYGALFLKNEFARVEVVLARPETRTEGWPADGRFSLLHRSEDEFYLYAPAARRVWMVPRDQLQTLVFLGLCGVFAPADGCGSETIARHTLEASP